MLCDNKSDIILAYIATKVFFASGWEIKSFFLSLEKEEKSKDRLLNQTRISSNADDERLLFDLTLIAPSSRS